MATNNKMQNIPRWMTQPTPSVGSATNQLNVVSPDDLQMASQMYGQVSNRFFDIANQMAMSINFIHSDKNRILETEGVMKAREEIEALTANEEIVNDDKKLKDAISDIANKHTEDAGYFTGGKMRYIINNEIGLETRMKVSQNRVNIDQEKTRLDNKNLLFDNINKIYMNPAYTSEQKLAFATEEKERIYKNKYLYSPKMHAEADEKILKIKNTQQYIDGKIDTILDKNLIDSDYLDILLNRHDAAKQAEKLSMTFQQASIYSEAKNRKDDGYAYFQKNKEYLDKQQIKSLESYFNVRSGKSISMQEWKSHWSSENLLNKTYQDLELAARGDPSRLQFLVNTKDKQKRQSEDNRDLSAKFYTAMGLPDIDKLSEKSEEHIRMIEKYGIKYKEKIHLHLNRIISDRDEFIKSAQNTKNVIESKMIYEEKKLPTLLNIMKEELRNMNQDVSKKKNNLVESQMKLKR